MRCENVIVMRLRNHARLQVSLESASEIQVLETLLLFKFPSKQEPGL